MQQHELLEFILDTLSDLGTLHKAAAATAERAWSVLGKHDMADFPGVSCGDQHRDCLSRDRLMVNPATFTVEWHGQHCDLGPTILFRLIQHLAHRPGRYLSYDILMEEVWERRCSNATVRSAVKRLRRALCDAGMPDLAAAIRGRRECYGVFLDDNCS
jgi:DNA-binding response OmpR family regulator